MFTRLTPYVLLTVLWCGAANAVIIDRIAATVDGEVITLSQMNQMISLRIVDRGAGQTEEEYRRQVLNHLISQALRYRDVQRFGAADVSADAIEATFLEIVNRFSSPAEWEEALRKNEMRAEEVRGLIKRQIEVEAYIEERFSPLIFVSLEEIETYYREVWIAQRRERGLPDVPMSQVSAEIRTILKASRLQNEIEVWTTELRSRANVDIYVFR